MARLPKPSEALRWREPSIELHISPPARGAGLSVEDLQGVVSEAVDAWRTACPECSLPSIDIHLLRERHQAELDGLSTLRFDTGSWCPARPAEACYEPGRAAITHQHAALDGAHAGTLGEADIELNGAHFTWSTDGRVPGTLSLRAVVTHELGHFLGLPHSKDPGALMFPHPVDQPAALLVTPTEQDVAALRALYPHEMPAEAKAGLAVVAVAVCAIAIGLTLRKREARRSAPRDLPGSPAPHEESADSP